MQASKNDIKFVRSLGQKKFRQESQCFIAEGLKLVQEALKSDWTIVSIYTTDDDFAMANAQAIRVSTNEMESMTQLNSPSPYLVVLRMPSFDLELTSLPRICILDGIQDPGNLGTIIRTADWFGIRHLLCTTNTVEFTNPKVIQATMGSVFRCQIHCIPTAQLIELVKQHHYQLAGAVLDGEPAYQCNVHPQHALVIGSESHGISEQMQDALDLRITIAGEEGAESLNASIAAGILMAEFHRKWTLHL
jgi:RNA methyltransferase, TrmH family